MVVSSENSVFISKTLSMLILFLVSMLLGILPKLFNQQHINKNKNLIKICLCFGGGVLLCTTFLHLLPEVCQRLNQFEWFKNRNFGELLMCLGFFSMYFIEECLHFYLHRQRNVLKKTAKIAMEEQEQHQHQECLEQPQQQQQQKPPPLLDDHDHDYLFNDITSKTTTIRIIRGLLIVLALSIHELFEGLTVGLETSTSSVWYMFGGICVHKFIISFCIGLQLLLTRMELFPFIIYIFIFSIASPIGTGFGIWITYQSDDNNSNSDNETKLLPLILQGLASGTLLYVVFFEILQTERKSGLKQFLAVFLGFTTMYGLTFINTL